MEIDLKYINDKNGNITDVQIPIKKWKELLERIRQLQAESTIRKDLTIAFDQVGMYEKGEIEKKDISEILDEL
jgi:hypothetical protein